MANECWEEICTKLGWCLYTKTIAPPKPKGHYGIIGGGEEISLNVVRPCNMRLPPSRALDMKKNPHLIIGYLLKEEQKELGV